MFSNYYSNPANITGSSNYSTDYNYLNQDNNRYLGPNYNPMDRLQSSSPYDSPPDYYNQQSQNMGQPNMGQSMMQPGNYNGQLPAPMNYNQAPEGWDNMSQNTANFAAGGRIPNYKEMAEAIRRQGGAEDTVLAHINPIEAAMLKAIGGSGRINPRTKLPQYGFFSNPGKWFKSIIGPVGGTVVGNMLAPGLGGVIGGALGGAGGSAIRGRKDYLQAAMRGAGIGAMTPTIASGLGSGANALGMNSAGQYLSNYGSQNSVMSALSKLIGGGGGQGGALLGGQMSGQGSDAALRSTALNRALSGTNTSGAGSALGNQSFGDKMMSGTSDFLSKPKNLLTLAAAGSSMLGKKPKEKSPEAMAQEQKRYQRAMQLTPGELAEREAIMLAEEQAKRRIQRNKFLPEEKFSVEPIYAKTASPEEYERNKKWLTYYNNPQFQGSPLNYKAGGRLPLMEEGLLIEGDTSGQDDKIPAMISDGENSQPLRVSDGEYIVPADVLAILGDGNNLSGGKSMDRFIEIVRKGAGRKNGLPPKAKSLNYYLSKIRAA